jgi:hypothetical protein
LSLFAVNITWISSVQNPPLVDAILSPLGDWIRINGCTWFISTTMPQPVLADEVRRHFREADFIIVTTIAPVPASGWAQPWVWEWLNRNMTTQATPAHQPAGHVGALAKFFEQ